MRHDEALLLDMLLAARDAVEFASGLTFGQFEKSRLHQNATLKAVEIIGEAAARISTEVKEANPKVAWNEIVGMRNRLVHGYFEVDFGLVWQTVQDDIPELLLQLELLVQTEMD